MGDLVFNALTDLSMVLGGEGGEEKGIWLGQNIDQQEGCAPVLIVIAIILPRPFPLKCKQMCSCNYPIESPESHCFLSSSATLFFLSPSSLAFSLIYIYMRIGSISCRAAIRGSHSCLQRNFGEKRRLGIRCRGHGYFCYA